MLNKTPSPETVLSPSLSLTHTHTSLSVKNISLSIMLNKTPSPETVLSPPTVHFSEESENDETESFTANILEELKEKKIPFSSTNSFKNIQSGYIMKF